MTLSRYAKSPGLMLDVITCDLGCGIASVTTRNHACTAYCLPCVLKTGLTICAVVTRQPYQSAVWKDINVPLAYKLALSSVERLAPLLL